MLESYKACCCDERCESVETSQTPIAYSVYGLELQVAFCENRGKTEPYLRVRCEFRIWSTPINIFSAPFSSLLHRIQIQDGKGILKGLETHYTTIVEGNAKSRWEERLAFRNKERGKSQRVTVTRPSAA